MGRLAQKTCGKMTWTALGFFHECRRPRQNEVKLMFITHLCETRFMSSPVRRMAAYPSFYKDVDWWQWRTGPPRNVAGRPPSKSCKKAPLLLKRAPFATIYLNPSVLVNSRAPLESTMAGKIFLASPPLIGETKLYLMDLKFMLTYFTGELIFLLSSFALQSSFLGFKIQ